MTAMPEHGSMVRPIWGERVSGDAVIVEELEGGLLLAIVDVLGHGPEAHALASDMAAFLREHARFDVTRLMERLHERVRGSRGAAVSLCSLETESGTLRFVGVGNTAARRLGRDPTWLAAQDGTVGSVMPRLREEHLTLGDGDVFLLTTDGVSSRFRPEALSGLFRDTPAVLARDIVRHFGKQHDDAACLVLRYRR